MHLRVAILWLGLVLSSLVLLADANPLKRSGAQADANDDVGNKDGDALEYSDFEDDDYNDPDELLNSVEFNEENVNSVTHLHRERGEILVPCFGMWWPVGGPTYDYGGDYYGDYKRKRRRLRKKKKAAKMKKKKS